MSLKRHFLQESANPQPLRCFHETHNNPFLILQPIKLEVLHVDPDIFIVHDAVRGDQMDRLRCVSRPYIASELVIEPESYQVKLSRVRVAKRYGENRRFLDAIVRFKKCVRNECGMKFQTVHGSSSQSNAFCRLFTPKSDFSIAFLTVPALQMLRGVL